jgi:predicted nucleotide-binding protein
MASLYEYFVKDGAQNLTVHETWTISNAQGEKLGEIIARVHYDFDANAQYISFYIPAMPDVSSPEAMSLNKVGEILQWSKTKAEVHAGIPGEMKNAQELVFTGQIYIYSEQPVPNEQIDRLIAESKPLGHRLTFRSSQYMDERNKWEKPRAFVSHDHRDKTDIAEAIAIQLQKLMCPVWYDEFSLHVGDSLRDSIEKGLRESSKCIFILTPNFLANGGWAKREYDSIFTRELVEKKNVILPVWHNVSVQDVYQYSPILADRVGVQWSLGLEQVAANLLRAIDG